VARVDRRWASRNLGPAVAGSRPAGVVAEVEPAVAAAALPVTAEQRIQRDLIDFDSDSPAMIAFAARAPRTAATLASYVTPPWPKGLAPDPGARPTGSSLPRADVLIVTWTMDEGHALARVLTPGFDSKTDWKPYTKNYATIAKQMSARCPARQYGRLGTYWTAMIGKKRITLFKSDSHMSQDGPKLPNKAVWEQIIADCKPELVITTGTGGGIGKTEQVGDVVVSSYVSFDCQRHFASLNGETFKCETSPSHKRFTSAEALFAANSQFLPADNRRPPKIIVSGKAQTGIVTTDFFGFDNSSNTYGLQGKGDLSEMGDAVLGLACQDLGSDAPTWVAVRNVSDPQIDSTGLTLKQQAALAADIYKGYGRWSSVCSSIVCWALAAGL
jgi:nucleoside phosphorylase